MRPIADGVPFATVDLQAAHVADPARDASAADGWWELLDDLFCVVGGDGAVRIVTSAWRRARLDDRDDVVGSRALDRLHPDDARGAREQLTAAERNGRFSGLEARCRHADGSWRSILWSGVRSGDAWYCTGRDITESGTAARRMRERTDRVAALASAIRDGVCMSDGEGRIMEVNERFCEMTGFTVQELLGARTPYPFWPADEAARIEAAFRQALVAPGEDFELVFARKDGERFAVTIATAAVSEPAGGPPGVVGVMREVTRELRERERLREAQHVAGLASWEHDPATGRLELAGTAEIAGVRLPSALSLQDGLALLSPGFAETARAAIDAVVAGARDAAVFESAIDAGPADVRWIETRIRGVRDAAGSVTRLAGTTQDITARKRAELAREASEERLRQGQRLAGIGSFEVDYRTAKVTWSPELYRLVGIDPEDFSHDLDDARTMVPAPDGDTIRELCAATVADGRPRQVVHNYRRGPELRWAETRIEALPAAAGERYGVRGTMQDVTERWRADREIHLQAQLLDSVDAALIAMDVDLRVTHWNRGAERIYGWTREETVGRPLAELTVGPQDAETAEAILASVLETGQWEGEFDVRRKDGTTFPAYVNDAMFMDADGRPAGIVGVSVDISERVEAERRLRAASDQQRAITDSMGEGLYTVDTDGRLMYLNRAGEELLGWRHEELVGTVIHDVIQVRADGSALPLAECPLFGPQRDGDINHLDDEVFTRKDGTEVPVEVTSAPFETADGVRGSVVVFSDITGRKANERRLQEQLETMSWVGRIKEALAEDRFVLYAQPIVELASGETVQHELLIRMLDEHGAIVPPGDFLPAAERHGVITEIDRWVMRGAVALAAIGHAVELNVSAHSVSVPAVLDDFREE
ncbi:MAG: hypothetical protein QOF29_595, partial [bacterium]